MAPPETFAAKVRAEYPYVVRSLRRFGVATRDAEDLAQDVLVAAYLKWSELDPERPLRPWLLAFVVRRAANYRRKSREALAPVEAEAAREPHEERDLVLRALCKLPFEQRVVLALHDVDGYSVPEIAAMTDTPENTVYSRVRLAREGFRRIVKATEEEGSAP